MRMKTVMNHSQDGGLLKMISRTDPVISGLALIFLNLLAFYKCVSQLISRDKKNFLTGIGATILSWCTVPVQMRWQTEKEKRQSLAKVIRNGNGDTKKNWLKMQGI